MFTPEDLADLVKGHNRRIYTAGGCGGSIIPTSSVGWFKTYWRSANPVAVGRSGSEPNVQFGESAEQGHRLAVVVAMPSRSVLGLVNVASRVRSRSRITVTCHSTRQAAVVKQVEPSYGGQLDVLGGAPGLTGFAHFGLVEAIDRLGERVVIGTTRRPDQGLNTRLGKPFGEPDRRVLRPSRMVDNVFEVEDTLLPANPTGVLDRIENH